MFVNYKLAINIKNFMIEGESRERVTRLVCIFLAR